MAAGENNQDEGVFDDSLEAFAKQRTEGEGADTQGGTSKGQFTLTRIELLEKPPLAEELIEPEGGDDPCACNSVCACVPVGNCSCFSVCTCDTVSRSFDSGGGCGSFSCTPIIIGGG